MTKRKRLRANHEGSITKLSGKRSKPYAVRVTTGWDKDGKQLRKYLGYFKTKSEAKEELNKYLISPYDLDANKLTAQDIFEKWEKTAKVTDKVISAYRGVLNKSNLNKRVFKDIKLFELENAIKDFTPSIQKRFRNMIKNLYTFGMKNEIVTKNLGELLEIDKYVAGKRDAIKPADIKKILKGEDIIPKILLYTGLRIGELIEIKSANVDLKNRIMVGGLKTESGKNRRIPIHKELIPIIEKLLASNTEYLISNTEGKKVIYSNYLTRDWNTDEVLKTYSPHFTRHTFISRAVKLELNQQVLKAVVGHSSNDVTSSVYTHIDDEQLLDFIDSFNY
jgi:integrase